MKALAALIAIVIGIVMLPVVLASGDGDTSLYGPCLAHDGSLPVILATIRHIESRNTYTARNGGSTASGAYQFIDRTWNRYGGYRSAWQAPPAVQDAYAAQHVNGILAAHGNDLSAIPVVWYIGYVPAAGSPDWDTVPYPSAGNTFTPRRYQALWLRTYRRFAGEGGSGETTTGPGCAPSMTTMW